MLKIYLNTWGHYNEHGPSFESITLPMDADELAEAMERIAEKLGDNDPEWFVNDYEWECDIDFADIEEHTNIEELNETLQELADLSTYEQETVASAVEAFGYDLLEAIGRIDSFVFYQGMDLREVAEELVEDCYFTRDTPDIFRTYFDFDAFARDLGFDGYTETEWGVIYDG